MTCILKCHYCGFYQKDGKSCKNCGVNNRLKIAYDTEILGDIANKLTRIEKGKKKNENL